MVYIYQICHNIKSIPEEKEKGIMRSFDSKLRSDDYSLMNEATVLYSYRIGRPYLDSCLKKKNSLRNL